MILLVATICFKLDPVTLSCRTEVFSVHPTPIACSKMRKPVETWLTEAFKPEWLATCGGHKSLLFSQRGLEEVQEIAYIFPHQGSDFLLFRTPSDSARQRPNPGTGLVLVLVAPRRGRSHSRAFMGRDFVMTEADIESAATQVKHNLIW